MARYRHLPTEVEAIQWTGDRQAIWDWQTTLSEFTGNIFWGSATGLQITTLEGLMHVSEDDYIICGTSNELRPCKKETFADEYEPVGDEE